MEGLGIEQASRLDHHKATRLEITAEFRDLTTSAIYYQLSGEYRHKYLKTGKPVMDMILGRIEEIGWAFETLTKQASREGIFESMLAQVEAEYQVCPTSGASTRR